jgi:hypothetical protein
LHNLLYWKHRSSGLREKAVNLINFPDGTGIVSCYNTSQFSRRKRMKRRAVIRIALLLCSSLAIAQPGAREMPFSTTLAGGIHLRSIAGAPFSADVVKEFTRILSDGSQVPAVAHGRMFRDADGRTRSEIEVLSAAATEPRRFITIVDPVRQVSIILDQQNKTATIANLPAPTIAAQQVRLDQQAQENRVSARALAIAGSEELGTSTIEGFNVTGIRRTQPSDATENSDQPRAVVESWFSPVLKIELQARIAGPRLGETITKLQNIVAGEPDPMLFEVPADYTVRPVSAAK